MSSSQLEVTCTRLGPEEVEEVHAGIARSAEIHAPWIFAPQSLDAVREYLGLSPESYFRYGVRDSEGQLAGLVNVNAVVRGAFQNGFLGFFAFSPHQGRGLMRQGVKSVIELAFSKLELHRLEANIQPANERSVALVKSLGFRFEGHSPRYLKVGDAWCDHDRFALTVEDELRS